MNMDREAKEYYEVIIQAKDMGGQLGGLSGTTTVNITLSDVNDNPPRFPQSEYLTRGEFSSRARGVHLLQSHEREDRSPSLSQQGVTQPVLRMHAGKLNRSSDPLHHLT